MQRSRGIWKALLALTSVASIMVWDISTANADNVLFNANLDQIGTTSQVNPCPLGWDVVSEKSLSGGFNDGGDSEPWCNVTPPSDPNGYGFFFKPFQGVLGSGVGDLLSVYLTQDNPTTPGTKFTLSGYAAGERNYVGFFPTNDPAPQTLFIVEFLDAGGGIIASNGFDLISAGLPNGGPGTMSGFLFTTPQVTAPANTATVRAGAAMLNVYNANANPQNLFVDSFDLEATAPPGSPVITNQPAQTTVAPGGNAVFTVGVSNLAGVHYQWQHASTNISDGGEYSGTTTATLHINNASPADAGHYRVLVSNNIGLTYSTDAPLALVGIGMYPTVSISGKIGDTYRIDYSTAIAPSDWIPLSTNKLSSSPQLFLDSSFPADRARFYRAVFLY